MANIWLTEDAGVYANFEELSVVSPRITNAYFAKKQVTAGAGGAQPTVQFTEINDGIIGREVYIIVETSNFIPPGEAITSTNRASLKIQIKTGDNKLTGTADQAIETKNGDTFATSHTVEVGNLDALNDIEDNNPYGNLTDFTDKAIFKIALRPNTRATFDTWAENIHSNNTNRPKLIIEVAPEQQDMYVLYGPENNTQMAPDTMGQFMNSAGHEFEVENKIVYEIYHTDNLFNTFGEITANGNQVRRPIGLLSNNWARTGNYTEDSPEHYVTYFYHNKFDNEHEVCTTEQIRITEKGPRQNTIPNVAARGTEIPPMIDYRTNQMAGEDIDVSTMTRYTNGVHAIQYNKISDPNNPGNYIIQNTIKKERWYPVPNVNSHVSIVNMDIDQEAGMGPQVFTGLDYNAPDLRIRYCFKDTRRRHILPSLLAGLIGAIAQFNEGDDTNNGLDHRICGEGFSYEDGSCYPSTGHRNGLAGDLYYLSTTLTGVEVKLQDNDFDYTSQVILCDLLYSFGWSRTINSLSENFTNANAGVNTSTILPHSNHVVNPRHNNHHHIRGFNTNFVLNMLP